MVILEEIIFNQPIRKDIIHRVYQWSILWDKKTTYTTPRPGMLSMTRRKPFRQKGTGRARQGFAGSAIHVKGGKAHGSVPKDFRYHLPEKVKIQGLKAMLSAKLAEGKNLSNLI